MTTIPSRDEEGRHRTQDLALASYLSMRGNTCNMQRADGGKTCVWVFEDQDALIQEQIIDFNAGEARVEPRSFLQKVGEVRAGMYEFLGISPKRR